MIRALSLAVVLLPLVACKPKPPEIVIPAAPPTASIKQLIDAASELTSRAEQPVDEIQVQHILVSYKDSGLPGVTRTLDEAEQLAAELWARATAGDDFDAMVKAYTNDSYPGIYGLVSRGSGDADASVFPLKDMVPAFGDVGFRLAVGEVGVALYNPAKSPYGYHIIKRLK
jgi:parvulin-like peptidyl-prolyl isomerase